MLARIELCQPPALAMAIQGRDDFQGGAATGNATAGNHLWGTSAQLPGATHRGPRWLVVAASAAARGAR